MNVYLIKQFVNKINQWQVVAVIYNNKKIAYNVLANFGFNYPKNVFKIEKVGCKL